MDKPLPIIGSPASRIENHEQLIIEYATESIPSERHPERNGDAILADKKHKVFGVFDGVGGHKAGAVASQLARDSILTLLNRISWDIDVNGAKQALSKIIIGADEAMYNASSSKDENKDMITTAAVLKIHTNIDGKNWAIVANVGDSRVYKISPDNILQQMTIDDDVLNASNLDLDVKKESLKISRMLEEKKIWKHSQFFIMEIDIKLQKL